MAISPKSTLPKRWTRAELQSDAAQAKKDLRRERLLEPLDLYNQFFTAFAAIFQDLVASLSKLRTDQVDPKFIADLVDGRDAQKAFRYLTAPPNL